MPSSPFSLRRLSRLAWRGCLVLAMCLLLSPTTAAVTYALGAVPDTTSEPSDDLVVRMPPDERLARYRADEAYSYVKKEPDEGSGFLERLIWRMIDVLQTGMGVVGSKYALHFAMVCVIVYGFLTLLRMESSASRRPDDAPRYDHEDLDEKVPDVDFDALIRQATEDEAYRLTLRLMYLRALQVLDSNGWIRWVPERTNAQYERTLHATPLGDTFQRATHIFDVVWYGDIPVRRADFERYRRPILEVTEKAKMERSNFEQQSGPTPQPAPSAGGEGS
ncbi:MAG TPA: DUF4129 domain-containing protein [Longibacter sp.]